MAEYAKKQKEQLSRCLIENKNGSMKSKSFVDNRVNTKRQADGILQRKMIVKGNNDYLENVKENLYRLLLGNWKGISIDQKEDSLILDVDPEYEKSLFLHEANNSVSAMLVRRRIAALGEDMLGGNTDLLIKETDDSSRFDYDEKECKMAVMWNADEKMICYTENGFKLCPSEILLAHEIGHAEGYYNKSQGEGMSKYMTPFKDLNIINESSEEVRNVGLPVLPGSADIKVSDNSYSENMIRKERKEPERKVYSKLVSWWIKDNKLIIDPPTNGDLLNYYVDVLRLEGVKNIVDKEVDKEPSLPENLKLDVKNQIMLFLIFKKKVKKTIDLVNLAEVD